MSCSTRGVGAVVAHLFPMQGVSGPCSYAVFYYQSFVNILHHIFTVLIDPLIMTPWTVNMWQLPSVLPPPSPVNNAQERSVNSPSWKWWVIGQVHVDVYSDVPISYLCAGGSGCVSPLEGAKLRLLLSNWSDFGDLIKCSSTSIYR